MTAIAEDSLLQSHSGKRPCWDCVACARPWPCANAKELMLSEFQGFRSLLIVYMSAQMCEALLDLTAHGGEPPPDLYDRFLAWVHLVPTNSRSAHALLPEQSPSLQVHRDRNAADLRPSRR
jgi:hypothetical protein